MLAQLIYESTRTKECTDNEITKILDSSNRNNGTIDITGVLLYSKTQFLQVLEGEHSLIVDLYQRIKSDPRHSNAVIISLKHIKERYFPSWQMGSKQINTETYDFLTDMTAIERHEFRNILNGEPSETAIKIIHRLFK